MPSPERPSATLDLDTGSAHKTRWSGTSERFCELRDRESEKSVFEEDPLTPAAPEEVLQVHQAKGYRLGTPLGPPRAVLRPQSSIKSWPEKTVPKES